MSKYTKYDFRSVILLINYVYYFCEHLFNRNISYLRESKSLVHFIKLNTTDFRVTIIKQEPRNRIPTGLVLIVALKLLSSSFKHLPPNC